MERRLAAILAADVVGYSRMMEADEAGTLARLNGLRKERIEPLIADHRGRIFKLMGDGILVEFSSVVDAVDCAAAWQAEGHDEHLRFRIGINLGDVIVEDGDVFGNGVNVAARLETLADAGGICLSGSVYDQVQDKLDLGFEDMGAQTVKNIAEPVRAYRVVLDGVSRPEAPLPTPNAAEKLSVAVLPLNNMSPGAAQDAFADGITEDIITALARSYVFDVTARNSTFAYKGQSPDIREVAKALGVNYVLEGSVRQGSGRARITVQLIEAASGTHVWADRYDRLLEDEFAVQDEIAQRVSSILQERIWQDVARTIGKKDRRDYGIYDYVFRGLELLHRLDPATVTEAETYFQAALHLEADSFLGHLGLGFCYATHAFWSDPGNQYLAKAHNHGLTLAKIGPESSQTWRLLSRTYCGLHQWDECWSCADRALKLDPNDGDIIGNQGVNHLFYGETDQAVEWLDKVLELHADTPQTVDIMRYWKALALFTATDYAGAASLLRSVSGHDFIRSMLQAACHARLGEIDLARTQAELVLHAFPDFRLSDLRQWKSFRHEAEGENLRDALRKAGLPE